MHSQRMKWTHEAYALTHFKWVYQWLGRPYQAINALFFVHYFMDYAKASPVFRYIVKFYLPLVCVYQLASPKEGKSFTLFPSLCMFLPLQWTNCVEIFGYPSRNWHSRTDKIHTKIIVEIVGNINYHTRNFSCDVKCTETYLETQIVRMTVFIFGTVLHCLLTCNVGRMIPFHCYYYNNVPT